MCAACRRCCFVLPALDLGVMGPMFLYCVRRVLLVRFICIPWYFPYPPCTFSCLSFWTSRSNILVLAGLSNPAALRICVALIQLSPRRRITITESASSQYIGWAWAQIHHVPLALLQTEIRKPVPICVSLNPFSALQIPPHTLL